MKFIQYWNLDNYQNKFQINNLKDSILQFENLFTNCLKIRLRTDVPLVTMLSGGLDSSAITALAFEKFNSANFSIISKNKSFQRKFIDILNFKFKFNSNKYDFNIDNLNEVLLNTIKCQQEPFAGFSIVAQNLLFKKFQ